MTATTASMSPSSMSGAAKGTEGIVAVGVGDRAISRST